MTARILVGGFSHELNSFVPGVSGFEELAAAGPLVEGDAMFGRAVGRDLELNAVADIASREGIELIPTVYMWGGVGPVISADVYGYLRKRILAGVRENLGRIDGVYLALHGAMAAQGVDDTEGDIISAVRNLVGTDVPIAVPLDLHAHMTEAMAQADVVIGYRTCPHTDYYETGARVMELLLAAARHALRPRVAMRKLAITASAEGHDTTIGPMRLVMARAREIEKREGVIAVSVLATQPWMDVPDIGWSVVVVADGDIDGQAAADELALDIWERREEFRVTKTPVPEALRRAQQAPNGPVVLADSADTTTGGGNGDGNVLLGALLSQRFESACIAVTDAPAVAACIGAGVGATVTLPVGGTLTPEFFRPVEVVGEVVTIGRGTYESELPVRPRDVGRFAVVQSGGINIVISELKASQLDESIYRRAGLWPRRHRLISVKSAGGFRAAYDSFAAATIYVDTPGPCDSDLVRLPFKRITRPLWPFDPDLDQAWRSPQPSVRASV